MFIRLSLMIFIAAVTVFSQVPRIEPGVSKSLAEWRAVQYSNISYKLNLTLEKMSPVLRGSMEIRVTQAAYACADPNCPPMAIILDWRKIAGHEKDSTISNVTLNGLSGTNISPPGGGADRSVRAPYEEANEHLIFRDGVKPGENVIKLDFTSPILTSGSAITRYVDKEDGAEYIYSLFVPSDASTAFPVFDQPDLKAKFSLTAEAPEAWKVVSNTRGYQHGVRDCIYISPGPYSDCPQKRVFDETKPISTYVFAFAAGPWKKVSVPPAVAGGAFGPGAKTPPATAGGTDKKAAGDPATNIYVRKSQAAKFKPHAAEVFRLTREGIKYLETYFDYKFPFPKYDLVLIPEFPFGGMEHAGATFLRESSVIFPTEPTKGDYISRANLIFHETAHQWFGDTVTMKWFDDLWLKEGFAEFMAYKTLEKVMPDANAWKVFYERNKQAAYLTDSTKGTTPIYQEIANLNSAKSAYGNIVYRKAPSFLRQAEFYLGPDKFQPAVRAFLKKHEYANAGWEDLVKEFETASGQDLRDWANTWVRQRGLAVFRTYYVAGGRDQTLLKQENVFSKDAFWRQKLKVLVIADDDQPRVSEIVSTKASRQEAATMWGDGTYIFSTPPVRARFVFPNYQDYGYGIFLLDDKSRDYVLKNIQNEKDPFLRSMMWGSLWDSVREGELDPKEYVELVIRNLTTTPSAEAAATPPNQGGELAQARALARTIANRGTTESDESTIATLLSRVSTAMNYYIPAAGVSNPHVSKGSSGSTDNGDPCSKAGRSSGDNQTNASKTKSADNAEPLLTCGLQTRIEAVLIERMQNAPALGQRITFYRAFLNIAATENARVVLKQMLKSVPPAVAGGVSAPATKAPPATAGGTDMSGAIPLRLKDRYDIVAKLLILNDPAAPGLLDELVKSDTSDEAHRYAYAARSGIQTAENKAKFWIDYTTNKDISESWIEASLGAFNSTKHADLTLPYFERALKELPNLKRNRKIFFVNAWLAAFIGGQRSEEALGIVNKFLADNPTLDKDLRLKILENADLIERAVKIRAKFGAR